MSGKRPLSAHKILQMPLMTPRTPHTQFCSHVSANYSQNDTCPSNRILRPHSGICHFMLAITDAPDGPQIGLRCISRTVAYTGGQRSETALRAHSGGLTRNVWRQAGILPPVGPTSCGSSAEYHIRRLDTQAEAVVQYKQKEGWLHDA